MFGGGLVTEAGHCLVSGHCHLHYSHHSDWLLLCCRHAGPLGQYEELAKTDQSQQVSYITTATSTNYKTAPKFYPPKAPPALDNKEILNLFKICYNLFINFCRTIGDRRKYADDDSTALMTSPRHVTVRGDLRLVSGPNKLSNVTKARKQVQLYTKYTDEHLILKENVVIRMSCDR